MINNNESNGVPEVIDEDDAIIGYDITWVLETMRAHEARPDDGQCRRCRETIVKGCATYVYGDKLCMGCGSDRKVRL